MSKRAWTSGFNGGMGKRAWNSGFNSGMGKRAWNSGFNSGMGKRAWNSGFSGGSHEKEHGTLKLRGPKYLEDYIADPATSLTAEGHSSGGPPGDDSESVSAPRPPGRNYTTV